MVLFQVGGHSLSQFPAVPVDDRDIQAFHAVGLGGVLDIHLLDGKAYGQKDGDIQE